MYFTHSLSNKHLLCSLSSAEAYRRFNLGGEGRCEWYTKVGWPCEQFIQEVRWRLYIEEKKKLKLLWQFL